MTTRRFYPTVGIWRNGETIASTDEFFYVIDGRLRIELESGDLVELEAGMAFSVPRGMLHRPVALEPTQVLMIEKAGVAVTGDRQAAPRVRP